MFLRDSKYSLCVALLSAGFFALIYLSTGYLLFIWTNFPTLPLPIIILTTCRELLTALLLGAIIYSLLRTYSRPLNIKDLPIPQQAIPESQLLFQATHDTLTGLANRFSLHNRIEQAIAQAKRNNTMFALLFFDLNRFKPINDSLGHEAGDLVLQQVANRLTLYVREVDTLARLGGDEFVLLAMNLGQENRISGLIEKFLTLFSQPFSIQHHELFIDCSIGISIYPLDGQNASTLLRHADIAMYKAKKNHVPFEFYTAKMHKQITERLMLENELRHALLKEEIVLHYHPVFDLHTHTICATEVLARWNHPTRGLLYPNSFIPIAEESGLMPTLGEWILRAACTQNKAWHNADLLKARISVNISGSQLKKAFFYRTIEKILSELDYPPKFLELELTENSLVGDFSELSDILENLKNIGMVLSIDDFGTGFSNLNYLKNFPIDKLKINRMFVQEDMAKNKGAVQAIIALAKNLEQRVVAEGVETKEQLELLEISGCDEAQGYYFSKPLDAQEYEQFVLNFSKGGFNRLGN